MSEGDLIQNLTMNLSHKEEHGLILVRQTPKSPPLLFSRSCTVSQLLRELLLTTNRSQPMDEDEANQVVQSLNQSAWQGAIRDPGHSRSRSRS